VEDWAAIFGSYLKSGVFKVVQESRTAIRDAALTGKLEFVEVDLKGVRSKAGFLKKTAAGLGFPPYFGMNWDAFSDCLTDMAWRPAAGYVILLNNYQTFAAKAPADARVAGKIFDSSAQYWIQRKVPFYVILSEERS
jgi:hypothetical protein